jgi:hypothetical protein
MTDAKPDYLSILSSPHEYKNCTYKVATTTTTSAVYRHFTVYIPKLGTRLRPTPKPILGQYTPPPNFLKNCSRKNFNIILSLPFQYSKLPTSKKVLHQNYINL